MRSRRDPQDRVSAGTKIHKSTPYSGPHLEEYEDHAHEVEHTTAEHHPPERRVRSRERSIGERQHRDYQEEEDDTANASVDVVLKADVRVPAEENNYWGLNPFLSRGGQILPTGISRIPSKQLAIDF